MSSPLVRPTVVSPRQHRQGAAGEFTRSVLEWPSANSPTTRIGSAVGPALFALVDSIAGSYQAALWISMLVAALGLVLALATRRNH